MKLHQLKCKATPRWILAGLLVMALISSSTARDAQGSTVTGRGINSPQRLVTLPQPP